MVWIRMQTRALLVLLIKLRPILLTRSIERKCLLGQPWSFCDNFLNRRYYNESVTVFLTRIRGMRRLVFRTCQTHRIFKQWSTILTLKPNPTYIAWIFFERLITLPHAQESWGERSNSQINITFSLLLAPNTNTGQSIRPPKKHASEQAVLGQNKGGEKEPTHGRGGGKHSKAKGRGNWRRGSWGFGIGQTERNWRLSLWRPWPGHGSHG